MPFLLGAALASYLYADGRFFTAEVSRWQSMMYLGAAMSVTAFPVLARIIQERGIGGTALGTLALAAGAVDDLIAWSLLGVVLVSVDRTSTSSDFIASHAVFFAFVIGALMPRGPLTQTLQPSNRAGCSPRAGAAVFRLFGIVHTPQPALVGRAAVALDRSSFSSPRRKGRRVLGRGAPGGPCRTARPWRLAR